MTKVELANTESSVVRHNATFFNLFKKYYQEDLLKYPEGCESCDFKELFEKWSKTYILQKKVELIIKNNIMKGYTLVDENYLTYFKGEVLSKDSPAEQWTDFISEDENRKLLFSVLPEEISTDAEKIVEAKKTKETEAKKNNS